jgi:hypothetical protein
MNIQTFFSKMIVAEYLKGIDIAELKERVRNTYIKIKNGG